MRLNADCGEGECRLRKEAAVLLHIANTQHFAWRPLIFKRPFPTIPIQMSVEGKYEEKNIM